MARTASTSSRIRAAGADHGIEKRRSMWALIWLPRPRWKRPPESAWRSHAWWARVIGFRANAMATAVVSSSRSVASAASTNGRNGSCGPSKVKAPS